jgi:hypothetical protein
MEVSDLSMKTRILTLMALLLCCRPSGEESSSEDASGAATAGATEGDPYNCGELGLMCTGALGIGSCVDGACGPALHSQCVANQSCDTLCGTFGRTCAEQGCEGATAFAFIGDSQAESDALCLDGRYMDAVPADVTCGELLPLGQSTTWLCCCDQ